MGVDLELYNQDYGQRVKIDTWCSQITTASAVYVRFRKIDSTATHRLSAVYVPDDDKPAKYPCEVTIPSNWCKDKLGLWIVQPEIQWDDALIHGKPPLTLKIVRTPCMTTTTTSTTSTTSTTTTAP